MYWEFWMLLAYTTLSLVPRNKLLGWLWLIMRRYLWTLTCPIVAKTFHTLPSHLNEQCLDNIYNWMAKKETGNWWAKEEDTTSLTEDKLSHSTTSPGCADVISICLVISHVNEYPTKHYFGIPDKLSQW